MTDTPPDLRFLASHEWIRLDQETKIATVGISNFAQEQLGDVVYVELPEVGAVLISGDEVAVVESVKACLLYTSPSPRDSLSSRMPSSA